MHEALQLAQALASPGSMPRVCTSKGPYSLITLRCARCAEGQLPRRAGQLPRCACVRSCVLARARGNRRRGGRLAGAHPFPASASPFGVEAVCAPGRPLAAPWARPVGPECTWRTRAHGQAAPRRLRGRAGAATPAGDCNCSCRGNCNCRVRRARCCPRRARRRPAPRRCALLRARRTGTVLALEGGRGVSVALLRSAGVAQARGRTFPARGASGEGPRAAPARLCPRRRRRRRPLPGALAVGRCATRPSGWRRPLEGRTRPRRRTRLRAGVKVRARLLSGGRGRALSAFGAAGCAMRASVVVGLVCAGLSGKALLGGRCGQGGVIAKLD